MGEAKPEVLELADDLMTVHDGHADEGPTTFSEAAALLRTQHAEIESLRAEAAENAQIIGMGAEREVALRAQVEALRVDGERYRRLRDCNDSSQVIVQVTGPDENDWHVITGEEADAAIDAAREKAK